MSTIELAEEHAAPVRKTDDTDMGNAANLHLSIYDLDKLEIEIDDDGDLTIRDRSARFGAASICLKAALIPEFIADIQRAVAHAAWLRSLLRAGEKGD